MNRRLLRTIKENRLLNSAATSAHRAYVTLFDKRYATLYSIQAWVKRNKRFLAKHNIEGWRFENGDAYLTKEGLSWFARGDSPLERLGLEAGAFEPVERMVLTKALPARGTLLDIGANFGYHAITLAKENPSASVHAFEPVPRTLEALRKNVAINACTNVTVVPSAVGETAGTLQFTDTLDAENHAAPDGPITVPVTTVDTYVREARIKRVDVMKIDVEGADVLVLRGATATITRDHPVILIELFQRWADRYRLDIREAFQLLGKEGYTYEVLTKDGKLVPSSTFEYDTARGYNFLFTPTVRAPPTTRADSANRARPPSTLRGTNATQRTGNARNTKVPVAARKVVRKKAR